MASLLQRGALLLSREKRARRTQAASVEDGGQASDGEVNQNTSQDPSEQNGGDETFSGINSNGSETDGGHDKKRRKWGGNMVQSIKKNDGDFSKYSDECLSVHGLYYAFYSQNGVLRTVAYLSVWLAAGWFFLYLTVPLIQDYTNRHVTTSVSSEASTDGLPLPVLTVCPHGRGIRCDCPLWRKLYCRYSNDVVNEEWRTRFAAYGCLSFFDNSTGFGNPIWDDPMCEGFQTLDEPADTCGPTASEIERNPELSVYTGESMFQTIVGRENGSEGPYITHAELAVYAPIRMANRVFFMQEARSIGLPLPVPDDWIIPIYLEIAQLKVCTQVRPPRDAAPQNSAGAILGLSVVVTNVVAEEAYPLEDAMASVSAVDIHVNMIHPESELHDSSYLPVEGHVFETIAAGNLVESPYKVKALSREKGWGPLVSRRCEDTGVPRSLCVQNTVLDFAAVACGCPGRQSTYDVEIPFIYSCSATVGTTQNQCTNDVVFSGPWESRVSYETCPTLCESREIEVSRQTSTPLSDGQMRYLRASVAAIGGDSTGLIKEETVFARFGAGTLLIEHLEENAKTSFAALMGQIGGNAGLWCGLSFVLMFETLEFSVVAIAYALRKRMKARRGS